MSEASEDRVDDCIEFSRIDFTDSIKRLELRAKRNRRRVLIVSTLLIICIGTIVMLLFSSLAITSAKTNYLEAKFLQSTSGRSGALMEARVSDLMGQLTSDSSFFRSEFVPPETEEIKKVRMELSDALSDLERYRKIYANEKTNSNYSTSEALAATITSAVFSLGAVGFVVLLIQIAITFMRYYTRLAELYEAQADSLKASNGDPKLAYEFMSHFSPNSIELGSAPTTLYEKALDTIQSVAIKKS